MTSDNTLSLTFENQVLNFELIYLFHQAKNVRSLLSNDGCRYNSVASKIANDCLNELKDSIQIIQETTRLNLYTNVHESCIINRVEYYGLSAEIFCTYGNELSVHFRARRYHKYGNEDLTDSARKKLEGFIKNKLIDYYTSHIDAIRTKEISKYKAEFLNLLIEEDKRIKMLLAGVEPEFNIVLR